MPANGRRMVEWIAAMGRSYAIAPYPWEQLGGAAQSRVRRAHQECRYRLGLLAWDTKERRGRDRCHVVRCL